MREVVVTRAKSNKEFPIYCYQSDDEHSYCIRNFDRVSNTMDSQHPFQMLSFPFSRRPSPADSLHIPTCKNLANPSIRLIRSVTQTLLKYCSPSTKPLIKPKRYYLSLHYSHFRLPFRPHPSLFPLHTFTAPVYGDINLLLDRECELDTKNGSVMQDKTRRAIGTWRASCISCGVCKGVQGGRW